MCGATVTGIAIFAQILLISASPVPPCQISDSECLKMTSQQVLPTLIAGISDLNTPSLDSLHVDKINVELAGLELAIKDAEITGLSKSVIDKVSINTKKQALQVVYHADVVLKGKYKAAGKLLILPISGDGDVVMDIKNVEVKLRMPYELVKNKDGQDTLDLKSFSLKYDVRDGARFDLTNLFNGNKELSDSMLLFMNENWKVLTEEFGMPIFETSHKIIFEAIKKYVATQSVQTS